MKINELQIKYNTDLAITHPDETISKVAAILSELNIGALPVCDQSGDLIGIISERDIVRGFSENGDKLSDLKVSNLMTSEVITCRLEDNVNEIMEVMNKCGFRHLPVLDDDRLYSIISSRDVMAAILEEMKTNFRNMALAYETVR